jgi:hypothetical protein
MNVPPWWMFQNERKVAHRAAALHEEFLKEGEGERRPASLLLLSRENPGHKTMVWYCDCAERHMLELPYIRQVRTDIQRTDAAPLWFGGGHHSMGNSV